MKVINISSKQAIDLAVEEIHKNVILVQLPTVFGLFAAPTTKGAQQLDECKQRLEGKNYGTAIGNLDKFISQAKKEDLPKQFCTGAQYRKLKGSFIKLRFQDENFQSKAINHGTHQGLLLNGAYSKLFKAIESSFESYPPDELWNRRNYCAPLCTSCNISGDPAGSIVEFEKALSFGIEKGINLCIITKKPAAEKGSYPILGFSKNKVFIHREGPGLNRFKEEIPAELRSW